MSKELEKKIKIAQKEIMEDIIPLFDILKDVQDSCCNVHDYLIKNHKHCKKCGKYIEKEKDFCEDCVGEE